MANPKAEIIHINGLTGQGAFEFADLLLEDIKEVTTVVESQLRFLYRQQFVLIALEKQK